MLGTAAGRRSVAAGTIFTADSPSVHTGFTRAGEGGSVRLTKAMQTRAITHAVAAFTFLAARLAFAIPQPHPDGEEDKSLAPHFEVAGGEQNAEQFPLKATDVRGDDRRGDCRGDRRADLRQHR